jgi:alpha-tubulin suppressor-like RCC1 family protein
VPGLWRLALVGLALGAAASPGCKRHKPPARARVWLGASHACATTQVGGALECWGANAAGQLGDGTATGRLLPQPVAGAGAIAELALGARHTCASRADGVRCWGDGARGQLGSGSSAPVQSAASASPVLSGGAPLLGVTRLVAAGERTCALGAFGVRCWGDGVLEAASLPLLGGPAAALAVGDGHVCAALLAPKGVRCAGADLRGEAAGQEVVLAGAAVVGLDAGAHHTCAVLDDGAVFCWGGNDAGQLGDGTTTDARVPARVSGLPPSREVRAGARHTCARLRNDTVACWGANDAHQLANGTDRPSARPSPVTGLLGVQELSVAGDSACARLVDGSVRCWGGNATGQLGDGTVLDHAVPMPVKAAPLR